MKHRINTILKRDLIPAGVLFILSGCLQNSLVEPFDCNMTDLSIQLTVTDTPCGLASGEIDISVTGGLAPYRYSLNGQAPQESPIFTGLAAGDFSVSVTDGNNCNRVEQVSLGNTGGLAVTTMTLPSDCRGETGKIILTATGGLEPYSYQLDNGSPQASNEFTVGAGNFIATTVDANGCSFESNITVLSNTSYQNDVSPIIMASCATTNCHDGTSQSRPNFNDFSIVQANASSIRIRTQNGSMPPNGSLTQEQKDLIACWVDDGTLDN